MAHDHGHHDHSSDHDHDSNHGHGHGPAVVVETEDQLRRKDVLRRLYQACFLCSCFLVVEIVGGLMAHSLAILSDAAHLFADLASFAVAIAASYLASMPATRQHTFGLKRTESLAALFSMVSLAFVSVGLGYEAIHRLMEPSEELVQGKIMSGVASIGVLVNIALAIVLGEDHVHMPGAHEHSHDHGDHDGHGHGSCGGHGNNGNGITKKDSAGYEMLPSYQNQEHSDDHQHGAAAGTAAAACDDEEGHAHAHHDHSTTAATSTSHDGHFHDHDHGNGSAATATAASDHHAVHSSEVRGPSAAEKRNVNLHAAYLHVMADLAQSVAVLIAGLVIWVRPDWYIIDPILTLLFATLVLYSTFGVLRSSISVLLEETPPSISWRQVHEAIAKVSNVNDVHDLHIWSISHGQPTLSVHCQSTDPDALRKIRDECLVFGIIHATIQVQDAEGLCLTCGDATYCTRHLA
jgi:zinc transporter 2